ncbi:hypothetical protein MOQ_002817 [Trypanosoma cruzi marinkellei]|uniref:Uncharacterized protein n=1 Tax=Trypanosoma cruzi marinkellei TaxID=85056 RepID=K2N1I9_TRYCR|nr:hypothetical protein MOQ_002817 [Trypanosoma cruzi marinkellei]
MHGIFSFSSIQHVCAHSHMNSSNFGEHDACLTFCVFYLFENFYTFFSPFFKLFLFVGFALTGDGCHLREITEIAWLMALVFAEANFTSRRCGIVDREMRGDESTDDFYLPVEFLDDTQAFSFSPRKEDGPYEAHATDCIYPGSIAFTRVGITLSLVITPHRNCVSEGTKIDDPASREVVVFSDIIDVVTGFCRWVSASTQQTLWYSLELLGGAHCVIFRPDDTRVAPPHVGNDTGGEMAVEGTLPLWVRRITAATEKHVETVLWPGTDDDTAMEVNDTPRSTFSWRRLQVVDTMEQVGSSKGVLTRNMGTDAAEWDWQRQNCFYDAFSAHISLMREETMAWEDILLKWASSLVHITTSLLPTAIAAESSGSTTIAQTSLSLRGLTATQDESQVNGEYGMDITNEVMQLLAEEEKVARMKFAKYSAAVRKGGRGK